MDDSVVPLTFGGFSLDGEAPVTLVDVDALGNEAAARGSRGVVEVFAVAVVC